MRALIFLLAFTLTAHAEILIGVAGPMSGPYASFGQQMLAGVNEAVDDINAKGGIAGDLVEVTTADDLCDVKQAEIAAKTLINQNVSVVIGHFCSHPSLAAAKLYDTAGITMIAPSATLPALTEAGQNNIIRLASREDSQGAFAAARMQQDFTSAKIAVVNDGTAPSQALVAKFNAGFTGQTATTLTFKPDAADFANLLAELKSKNIAAIYCACSAADAGTLANQSDGIFKIFGPDALLAPQFWEVAGDSGEGTAVSFAVDPQLSPDAKALIRKLRADEKIGSAIFLQAYAAVEVFAAARENNSNDLSARLHSSETISTILGKLSFDAKGDVQPQHFVWYVWANGKYSQE